MSFYIQRIVEDLAKRKGNLKNHLDNKNIKLKSCKLEVVSECQIAGASIQGYKKARDRSSSQAFWKT